MFDMNQVFINLFLFISFLGIFLSLVLVFSLKHTSQNNVYLAAFIFIHSLYALSAYVLHFAGSVTLLAIGYGTVSPLFFLMGPLSFLYVKGILKDDARLTKWDYLHFVPFIIQLINSLPYIFTSFDYKMQKAAILINDIGMLPKVSTGWFFTPRIDYIFRPTHIFLYTVLQFVLLVKWNRKEMVPEKQRGMVYQWLYLFCGICLILFGCFFAITLWAYSGNNAQVALSQSRSLILVTIVPFLMLNIIILFFPQLLYGLPRMNKKAKHNRPVFFPVPGERLLEATSNETAPAGNDVKSASVADHALEVVHSQIESYLLQNKPYLEKDFSITVMATDTHLPVHHLSYYFNCYLKEKFSDWRNRNRVVYAVNLIRAEQDDALSLNSIASASGFSSTASFITAFKQEMGITPDQYTHKLYAQAFSNTQTPD